MNSVNLVGRIVFDLQSKATPSGVSLLEFRIAVDRRFKDESGEKKSDFFDCVAWRQPAEYLSTYGEKGLRVAVSGRLEQQTWTKDNVKHSKVVIQCDQVTLLDRAKQDAGAQSEAQEDDFDYNPFGEE